VERYAPWMVPSGVGNEAIGKARDRLRSRFRSVAIKGAAQEIKGNVQKAAGDAKDAIKKSVNKVAGAISTFESDGPPRARRPALLSAVVSRTCFPA
jgi:uncharacterized protein YjbJ (UPF0337 family)